MAKHNQNQIYLPTLPESILEQLDHLMPKILVSKEFNLLK